MRLARRLARLRRPPPASGVWTPPACGLLPRPRWLTAAHARATENAPLAESRLHALGFERVVRHRDVNRSARFGGRHLERAAQQQWQALGVANFPGNLGELPDDLFLVEARPRAEDHVIRPELVVQQARAHHQRPAV